jgi:hypothetical protein
MIDVRPLVVPLAAFRDPVGGSTPWSVDPRKTFSGMGNAGLGDFAVDSFSHPANALWLPHQLCGDFQVGNELVVGLLFQLRIWDTKQ